MVQEVVGKHDPTKKSRVWLIKSNESGTRCSKVLAYEYRSGNESPNDYQTPIGVVYDHGEPTIHLSGTPAREYPAYGIYTTTDVSRLEGQLLTLVDASISDREQRKAFKDMVRQTVWRFNGDMEERVQKIFEHIKNDDGSGRYEEE